MRGKTLDVHLVDHELLERELGRTHILPIEALVNHNPFGHDRRVVALVCEQISPSGIVGKQQVIDVTELPRDGPRVRVEQQLGVVEA